MHAAILECTHVNTVPSKTKEQNLATIFSLVIDFFKTGTLSRNYKTSTLSRNYKTGTLSRNYKTGTLSRNSI